MALPVFPRLAFAITPSQIINDLPGVGYGVKWSPKWSTLSATAASGSEIDLQASPYPLHEFELTYPALRTNRTTGMAGATPQELQWLMGLWGQMAGSFGRFLFVNPDDCVSIRTPLLAPGFSLPTKPMRTTATSTDRYTIGRQFGSSAGGARAFSWWEPIGMVDINGVTGPTFGGSQFDLYVDATYSAGTDTYTGGSIVAPSGYTLSTATPGSNYVQFGSGYPGAGHTITCDVTYLWYCKFADNTNTFEKFAYQYFELKKLGIRSLRKGPTAT